MNRLCTPLFSILALTAIFFRPVPCQAAGDAPAPANQGLIIVAQTAKSTYASGESIKLDVIVRNSGDADASIGGSAFDLSSFRFVVLDPSSHAVPQTAFGKKLLAVPTRVRKNVPLKIGAGWQRRYEFELNRMYDLTTPGMYSVTVKRVVVVNRRKEGAKHSTAQVLLLASDPVALTITGPPSTTAHAAPKPAKGVTRWTIAFVREGDIWLADADGNEQRLVIHNGESPSWSPDKSLIAFARKGNVWISDPDGENQRQLTDSSSLEAGVNPVFSPDGKWVAYRSWNQRVGIMIRAVSVDGKTDKELIPDGEDAAW
jgi:hypothetical protein